MREIYLYAFSIFTSIVSAQTVTVLNANGPGNTYEDINAVLAPIGGDVIEAPGIEPSGSCTNHADFDNAETTNENRHIQEVLDIEMGNVFMFSIHVDEDIDRDKCNITDRQRNEIKTYSTSPDYLKGTLGETVEYKWSFKLPEGFKSTESFTHIHQLKSVGGISSEESIPMITLTIYDRASTGHKLYLKYSETTSQTTVSGHSIDISDLEDNWVEVIETVTYGYEGEGAYAITITDISNGSVLMDYSDNSKRYYKTDAEFMRPKWGIYRSLNDASSLRDEQVLYGSFTITESQPVLSNDEFNNELSKPIYPNPSKGIINLPFTVSQAANYTIEISNSLGEVVIRQECLKTNTYSINTINAGIYFVKLINNHNQNFIIKKLVKN